MRVTGFSFSDRQFHYLFILDSKEQIEKLELLVCQLLWEITKGNWEKVTNEDILTLCKHTKYEELLSVKSAGSPLKDPDSDHSASEEEKEDSSVIWRVNVPDYSTLY